MPLQASLASPVGDTPLPRALFTVRTKWVRNLAVPVRVFVATEVGGAVLLLAASLAALAWANSPWRSTYEGVWSADLAIRVAGAEFVHDLREWVNDGLMVLFFFVIGLEIRRELDLGDLRQRRRVAIPVLAAIGGMVAPALIYLAFNAGSEGARAWGIPISTDTAFALGVLALVGRRCPPQLRVFLLTLAIVDDIGALLVIALAYTIALSVGALLVASGLFGLMAWMRFLGVRNAFVYAVLGLGVWLATYQSGIHPSLAGLAMGLLASAYPASRQSLERAASLWRAFREQPVSQYARSASRGVAEALSPNDRLQAVIHPWTSYVIVPVFALANAGVEISGELLVRAIASPITLGIVFGLVGGKVGGITAASWLATRSRLGSFPLSVPWPSLASMATVAGIGFTISLFVTELSLKGALLQEAKVGILAASLLSAGLGWLAFAAIGRLPERAWRAASLPEALTDLADPVDADDHVRGEETARVTLVEYGDFECPYCGRAELVVRRLLSTFGHDLRYVFRHLPLVDVHEHAQFAAEAAEAAASQGRFWEMHDLLFKHQDALSLGDLLRYAAALGLDVDSFADDLRTRKYARRVARDIASADRSAVAGTPTFFINGRRLHGAYDVTHLSALVREAMAQPRRPK
jgi:Na+/H+ antiporter NhaA